MMIFLRILAVVVAIQIALSLASAVLWYLYALTVWQHASDEQRKAEDIPYVLGEYCRTHTAIGRVYWVFYLLSHWYTIVPRFFSLLLRGGDHDES